MATCSCGAVFNPDDAAEIFNESFNGEHDYFYEGRDSSCADCAISNAELDDEEGVDSLPECVSWCGSPNYPMCKDSCKLHDD